MVHDTILTEFEQYQVKQLLPAGFDTFANLLASIKEEFAVEKDALQEEPSQAWHGRRFGIELPLVKEDIKKNLEAELLNRSLLWHEEYHHYEDWEKLMANSYDNFNMLIIPHNKSKGKLYFDESKHKRQIPTGIIPHPFNLRKPMQLPQHLKVMERRKYNDRFAKFEADPNKDMI